MMLLSVMLMIAADNILPKAPWRCFCRARGRHGAKRIPLPYRGGAHAWCLPGKPDLPISRKN
jgi:hypothetical protein